MAGNPKVGVRQWRMLCALDDAPDLATSVGSLLTAVGITDTRGSVYDGIRGMVNRGLLRHVCHPNAECHNPGKLLSKHCWVRITDRGRDAVPTKVGRHGPRRASSG